VPLLAGVCVQVPSPLQESMVHGLPSSQVVAEQHSLLALWIASS
jgi:hypothetical protein